MNVEMVKFWDCRFRGIPTKPMRVTAAFLPVKGV